MLRREGLDGVMVMVVGINCVPYGSSYCGPLIAKFRLSIFPLLFFLRNIKKVKFMLGNRDVGPTKIFELVKHTGSHTGFTVLHFPLIQG